MGNPEVLGEFTWTGGCPALLTQERIWSFWKEGLVIKSVQSVITGGQTKWVLIKCVKFLEPTWCK